MNSTDAKKEYADIINLPHHQSTVRKHMSLHDRAAQFAPFAALSGYEEMVAEEARLTDHEIELSDSEIGIINGVITEIIRILENGGHPAVAVTYFKPDPQKNGGSYETHSGRIRRVDTIGGKLVFYGSDDIENKKIPTVDIPIKKLFHLSFCRDPEQ